MPGKKELFNAGIDRFSRMQSAPGSPARFFYHWNFVRVLSLHAPKSPHCQQKESPGVGQ